MSILAAHAWIENLCNKHDLYEYSILILVKLPNGHQFVTESAEIASIMQKEYDAESMYINQLGE